MTSKFPLPYLQLFNDNTNFLIGALRIRVQLPHPIHASLFVRLAVMLLRRRTVVVIGHVSGGDDKMTVHPREAMRAHVVLVLLEDYRSARDEEARIVGAYGRHRRLLATPDIDVANLEFGLHVAFQEVVNAGAKDAGSASEERIHGMRNGEDGVGTEHVIVIHGSKTVANVVDDDFDGAREEGVAGS